MRQARRQGRDRARARGRRTIGGAFNLAGRETLFGRYWGADGGAALPALQRVLLPLHRRVHRAELERFEPGAGGEHKLVRGFEPTITHSAHHLAHPGLDRAVREFLEREREAALETARLGEQSFR